MKLAANFRDLVGVPYVPLGRNPDEGLDCLGVVLVVYERLGWPTHPVGSIEYRHGDDEDHIVRNAHLYWGEIQVPGLVGDIAAFGSPVRNHLAVLVAENRWLHTSEHQGSHIMKSTTVQRLKPLYYRYRDADG